jgi:hypothetical protein
MSNQGVVKIISSAENPAARSASNLTTVPGAAAAAMNRARMCAIRPNVINHTSGVASGIGISGPTGINRIVTEVFRVGGARRTMRRHKLNFGQSYIRLLAYAPTIGLGLPGDHHG